MRTRNLWRSSVCAAIMLSAAAWGGRALAQDNVKPEQWKKMYEDALGELKASQDRKSELAKENERLAAEVERLKQDVAAARSEVAALRTQAAEQAQRSFLLRSHYAAWRSFLSLYPTLEIRWRLFVGADLLGTDLFEFAPTAPDDSGPRPASADPHWSLTTGGQET